MCGMMNESPEEVRRHYRGWEYVAIGDYHRNLDPNWSYAPTYLRKMAYVRSKIEALADPQKAVLDAGCGEGVLVEEFRNKGWNIVGLDLNYNSNFVERGDILSMPFEDEQFDCVLFLDVFEHLAFVDQPKALVEIGRVLKPEGRLIISVPNMAHLSGRFALMFRGVLRRTDTDINHPGERPAGEYKALLSAHGFSIVETIGITLTVPLVYRHVICRYPSRYRWLHDLLDWIAFPSIAMINVFVCRRRA
jgi:SAM-dependent methyltransferase